MKPSSIALAITMAVAASGASATTAKHIQDELTEAGYTQVHEINLGAEPITAKATKDGKEWWLVIDFIGASAAATIILGNCTSETLIAAVAG